MDYEKKYKEALERAKYYREGIPDRKLENGENILDHIFPELKESEDDRIRREMIEVIKNEAHEFPSSVIANKSNSWIAWLEKQGEQPYWKPSEEQLQTLHAQLNEGAVTYPEDKRILFTLYEDLMKIMTQEEKQGEQSPTDKDNPKFNVGYCKNNTRFEVGDWVVLPNNEVKQIEEVTFGNYWFTDKTHYNIIDVDNKGHLWTIQDAKDGDVLVEDSCMFIIEKMKSEGMAIVYCCLFDDGDFDLLGSTLCFDADSTYPATKEQRDILFQKMHEAGYEWDFEKKDKKWLKSIKPQPKQEWSEEDERKRKGLIKGLEDKMGFGWASDPFSREEYINWLKSLKDRVQL